MDYKERNLQAWETDGAIEVKIQSAAEKQVQKIPTNRRGPNGHKSFNSLHTHDVPFSNSSGPLEWKLPSSIDLGLT